jgi:hypothetical protein
MVLCSVPYPNQDPPDPNVFGPSGSGSTTSQRYGSGSGSFYHQAKIIIKNLYSCFVTSFGLLFLKNDVNVPSKSNEQKKQKNFF